MRFAFFTRTSDEPDQIEVAHESARYRVALRRSARARRLTLRISSATGEVVLTLPQKVPLTTAVRFAQDHGPWIAVRLAKLPVRVDMASGATIPLRGVPHRIVHWSKVRSAAQVESDAAGLPIIAVGGEAEFVQKRVREFLQREARRDLCAAVARHTANLGIPARRITIRDTRTRWGSCSSRGYLNFSWRLVLAPPFVLDYLAAHEVGHLKEMNHSHRFWRIVRELCPRTDEAEAWLKHHGTELHRYG
jgi:predicted metal-dependent hydrolase